NIAATLKQFADYSGLKVNVTKSKVFFSLTTKRGKISSIVASTGINRNHSLEKYLGFPMMHGRLQRRDYEFLEEKVSKKLASWQHNLLNKAGRMTLVKSVLNSIPNYYMQIAWLPQSTCDSIDRMARNFLWKGSSTTGIHLVGWDKITKPKKLGGLGIRKARDANTSLLGKLIWSIHQNNDVLWVQVIKHKYLKEEVLLTITKKPGSVTWNAIMKALSALKDGFQFRLGNDNSSFWYTDWSESGILANQVLYVDIHDLEMRVRDVYIDGKWNFNSLYTDMPSEVKDQLNLIHVSLNSNVTDCYTWKDNLNGIYTARDGYYWLNRHAFSVNPAAGVSWSWLWHLPAPEKIKFLLWTMIHHALPTRVMLAHRGILQTNLCPRCSINEETTLHCLRDCDFVKSIWKAIGFSELVFFQGDDSYEWLWNGVKCSTMFLFMAAVWWIWRARNALCLESEVVSHFTLRMCIVDYAHLLKNGHFTQHETVMPKQVRWNALGGTGMILNVDGSSIGNPSIFGFGGLIRNADGAWVHGFYGNLGVTNILHAELMAIFKAILNNIKNILNRDWQVTLTHTLREGNACADYLAKYGAQNNDVFSSIANPPAGLSLPLLADASGT
ncbi:RNA-directed DNA polymerase (Reverse transcriptase), partial [Trifolium medium]|nr:RNA-directed DNA polymerase (Reverse transcriptase) [Trifolium medium]